MEDKRDTDSRKRTGRQEEESKARRGLAALIVLAATAGCAFFLISRVIPSGRHLPAETWFGSGEGEAALVLNGELLPSKALDRDGRLYLRAGDASLVNPSVFYEEDESLLILTTPTEKRTETVTETAPEDGHFFLAEGTLYLAWDYLEEVTDMLYTSFEDPARLVITTDFEQQVSQAAEDGELRMEPHIKSPILADLAAGDEVILKEQASGESREGWVRASTQDGFTGYVREKLLADPEERTLPHESPFGGYTKLHREEPVNMVFHQTTSQASNNALSEALKGVEGVSVIAPTWFFLDSEQGAVASLASRSYVETAHEAGLEVWAVLNDFDGGVSSPGSTAAALSTDAGRSAIISKVMDELAESGADGLNIDFELVKADSAPDFLELVREFSAELRKAGLVFSICNYVPSFTGYYNRAEQARVADYLVVMCYDEYNAGSSKAGPTASLPFVRRGLEATISEAGAENVIAAIPFFTRLWTTENGQIRSEAQGMSGARRCVESLGLEETWDTGSGAHYAEGSDGGTTWQIWLEDTDSLREKMKVIAESGCAGCAEWKLGLEKPEVWAVIGEGLSGSL